MGYYTHFTLKYLEDNLSSYNDNIEEYLKNNKEMNYALLEGGEESKWYNHEADMLRLSKAFPKTTFFLSGEGEDSLDFWKEQYRNGKCMRVKGEVTYPPFPESPI